MGQETQCTARIGREAFAIKVHLNTERLELRGGLRLDVPFNTVKSIRAARNGELDITYEGGRVVLLMADHATAEKWAIKIGSPKILIDKLGVKPESRVVVIDVTDADFSAQLVDRLANGLAASASSALDFIFYTADTAAQLTKLKSLRARLQPAGAIWVVSRKGKAATLKDTDVMRAARAAGLVDNKVCSFSATHTALKLVIPKNQR
jgi:hypothetical protein